jgi:hypothetical protein
LDNKTRTALRKAALGAEMTAMVRYGLIRCYSSSISQTGARSRERSVWVGSGGLCAVILIAVAKAEQERKAERQKLANEQAAINGKRSWAGRARSGTARIT